MRASRRYNVEEEGTYYDDEENSDVDDDDDDDDDATRTRGLDLFQVQNYKVTFWCEVVALRQDISTRFHTSLST